ncbi:MAG: protein O-mannosyl-transferase family [Draconibacterium sp.]
MKQYKLFNNVFGWVSFAVAAIVYLMTIEPTVSFWDCGEFITTAFKFEVGHPPGAPIFMIAGRMFTLFGGPENAAKLVNIMSALASAFTIMFLFWTITHLARKIVVKDGDVTLGQTIAIVASGLVGALAYTFSDTFWFSAVEGEVYASSSLLTAIVFWAILKWENVADQPHANRWLVFISYIIGLSIGVHLLNLLAIPAIVFVYYFKKYEVTKKGIFWALVISIGLLGLIMYGIIPGVVNIGSWFELMFVNSFGLPFHSGVLFYVVLLIAAFAYGIYYTYKKQKPVWNTALLSIAVILIGYSSFAIIIIRSSAEPPMDQNSPNDTFSLLGYLNREQYGERPLFSGQYYNSPLKNGERFTEGRPIYSQIDGKYVVTHHRYSANYDERFTTFFPRMWSSNDPTHEQDYIRWGHVKGNRVAYKNERGENETIVKPTFSENLRFFFSYQVNFMYWRYFMWNFAGRQNDIQGHGEILYGNWLSGIKFIDEARLGDQDNLPARLANNKARNTYFFLPLLLGILGILYQYNKGKEGKKGLWVVFLLFVMTGLAIVVYLNQYPHQPRERDYAYAGSFYAFAIWIGLGVLSLTDLLKRFLPETVSAGIAGLAALILVPGIMGAQNWDDHDRSGRYTARDFGANYLKTCQKDGIIFTNGDNDTFPLWYNQEVEGVRTDMRVCNLSYLQTDWYISQMKRKAYDSDPVPFSMTEEKYRLGTRDMVYVLDNPRIKRDYIGLKEAVDFIADDNPATKLQQMGDAPYIPKKEIRFKVDKEAVLRNNVVAPEDSDKIVDEIVIDLSNKSALSKDEMMILDLIANNNWERPIYWAITVGRDKYLNLSDYYQTEGFAYRLVPIKTPSSPQQLQFGRVETSLMYDNLMNKFKWGNMNDPKVYIDENNARMMTNIRNSFNRLAGALIAENKNDSAIAVIDRCVELIPNNIISYEYFALELAENYIKAGAADKGFAMIETAYENANDELNYYFSLSPEFYLTEGVNEEIQRGLFYVQKMERAVRAAGNTELSDKIRASFEAYFKKYSNG